MSAPKRIKVKNIPTYYRKEGGKTLVLPFFVGLIIIFITFLFWYFLQNIGKEQFSKLVKENAVRIRNTIETHTNNYFRTLERVAGRWSVRGNTPREEWNSDAKRLVTDFDGFQAIGWVDQMGTIRWLMPEGSNEKALNFDLTSEPNRRNILEKAKNERLTTSGYCDELVDGGKGFFALVPIYTKDKFEGYIIGIFRVDKFIELSFSSNTLENYSVAVFDNNLELYQSQKADEVSEKFKLNETINIYGNSWDMVIMPTRRTIASFNSNADQWVLIAGVVFSVLSAWIVWLIGESKYRTKQITKINAGLKNEISERKYAQKSLQETLTLQNAVLNSSNYMIIATDPQGTIISFNKAAERNLGYQSEEVIGKTTPVMFHDAKEIAQRAKELSAESKEIVEPGFEVFVYNSRSNQVEECEWTYVRKDGSRFPIKLSVTTLRNEKGEITGFLGIGSDITKEKLGERALRESEARLREFVKHTPAAVAMLDSQLRYVMTSQRWLTDYHLGQQNIIGRSHYDVFPDIPQRWKDLHQRGLNGEILKCEEDLFKREDGSKEWLRWEIRPWLNNRGKIGGVIFFTEVITDRKQTEDKLSHFAAIVSSSEDAIISKGFDGIVRTWNHGAEIIFGYSGDEIIGKHISILFPEDRLKEEVEFIKMVKNGKSIRQYETVRVRKDGKIIPVSLTLSPIFDEKNVITGILKIARDITEQKKAESEIIRLNESLEQKISNRTAELNAANKELEAFSYSVSHDLRAPLRAMDGFSQALIEDYLHQFDETGKNYLARIRNASHQMAHLIDSMLLLSRVTRSELTKTNVNLSEMVRNISNKLLETQPREDVHFEIEENIFANCDSRLIKIALENLLNNAYKFTSKTAVTKISFGTQQSDEGLEFFVKDNGAGFDMAYIGKLFNAFQRLHPVSEFEGTGIGLATVYRVIRKHGGKIRAEGKVGHGAIFYFSL